MENGVEALKIACGMIIFVLAISITISSFTQATHAIQKIWEIQQEDEAYITDSEGKYLNYINFDIGKGNREVGVETIIPNMYRAYKENFAIYFFKSNGVDTFELYTNENGDTINYVDLLGEEYSGPTVAVEQLGARLTEGLYEKLAGNTFIEYLGEYYQDDLKGETNVAEVNKTKKRVIVYVQKNQF